MGVTVGADSGAAAGGEATARCGATQETRSNAERNQARCPSHCNARWRRRLHISAYLILGFRVIVAALHAVSFGSIGFLRRTRRAIAIAESGAPSPTDPHNMAKEKRCSQSDRPLEHTERLPCAHRAIVVPTAPKLRTPHDLVLAVVAGEWQHVDRRSACLLRWSLGRAPHRAADRGVRNGGQASSAGSARLIALLNFEGLDNGPNRGPPSSYIGRFL